MAVATAAQATDNWAAGMSGGLAVGKYKAGVTNCQVNPMALAAQPDKVQKYLDGVNNAVSSGRFVNGLNAATAQDWKDGCTGVGAMRFPQGVTKGKKKYARAVAKLQPVWQQMRQAADNIQGSGLAAAQAKSAAALQVLMQAFGKA